MNNGTAEPLTILCADDHTLVGDALFHVLAGAGYAVERVSDGAEAWAIISAGASSFDVVIAEHELRHVGGLQLAGRLRDAHFSGRVIVHSASVSDGDVSLYRAIGVEAIVEQRDESAKLLGIMKALHREA